MLVQSLLKITKLDAGSIVIEKDTENVADMMRDIELHFAYRARQEQKEIILSGSDNVSLLCDRDWLTEAIDNIVKNALDHTESGDMVRITWRELSSAVQSTISSNGFTAAVFLKTSRESGWVCRWQRPLWRPTAARLR